MINPDICRFLIRVHFLPTRWHTSNLVMDSHWILGRDRIYRGDPALREGSTMGWSSYTMVLGASSSPQTEAPQGAIPWGQGLTVGAEPRRSKEPRLQVSWEPRSSHSQEYSDKSHGSASAVATASSAPQGTDWSGWWFNYIGNPCWLDTQVVDE